MTMRTISKSKLKARMLEIFRNIESTGEAVVVTDHNKPALLISPLKDKLSVEEAFQGYRGKVSYSGDILEPTTEEWEET